jgi:hypothetical protein
MAGTGSLGGIATGALVVAALIAVGLLSTGEGTAQAKRSRPLEEGPEQYPDHPNRDDAFYFCTACHSFKLVAAQGMSRDRWDESLTWMVKRHNMPDVQGEDRKRILDYLEKAFPERPNPRGWQNPFPVK